MTPQIELSIEEPRPTRWQKVATWLANFEEAMNCDPHAYTNATISRLTEGLTQLESRVDELEQSS